MPLNDRQIKNAKPKEKPYKLSDGRSLYLMITPKGGKNWRLDYAFNGKRKTFSIGSYPQISLSEARIAAEKARKDISEGMDPSQAKKEQKEARVKAEQYSFENLTRQWHKDNLPRWKPNHADRVIRYMENDIFPQIGNKHINDIGVSDIKATIGLIVDKGAYVTAEKIR